jgi:hypothetical protein
VKNWKMEKICSGLPYNFFGIQNSKNRSSNKQSYSLQKMVSRKMVRKGEDVGKVVMMFEMFVPSHITLCGL